MKFEAIEGWSVRFVDVMVMRPQCEDFPSELLSALRYLERARHCEHPLSLMAPVNLTGYRLSKWPRLNIWATNANPLTSTSHSRQPALQDPPRTTQFFLRRKLAQTPSPIA